MVYRIAMSSEGFLKLKAFYKQLLPSMTEESWSVCQSKLTSRQLKKGDFLLREGAACNQVSFINKGMVRMYYLAGGKEKVVCFFNENSYVSDYQSFLTRRPAHNYIQALEDTEVIETSYDNLQALYKTMPEANTIGRLIAEQMFIMINESHDIEKRESLEKRYTRLINEQPWLLQKVPQYMIASLLNITPEALSRVKARMNKTRKIAEVVY